MSQCIADYLVARESRVSAESIRPRLAHVINFLTATDRAAVHCEDVDPDWIDAFREWAIDVPIISKTKVRPRTPSTVEASVRQLKAAINFSHARRDTLFPARFSPLPPSAVDNTPTYRASIETMAAMFAYATERNQHGEPRADRAALLRFLQLSVATWARPTTVHDVSTDPARGQWISDARVLRLNPKGRVQTRKFRPDVPVPERMAKLLDARRGDYVGVESVDAAFSKMCRDLGLPSGAGETGLRLIRRSMATIARNSLGEDRLAQIERMMGHRKSSTTDVYAIAHPGQLGLALEVTNDVIEAICKAVPMAFYRADTALKIINGGVSG